MSKKKNQPLRIDYTPLREIMAWDRNPKLHDKEGIRGSIERHGYVEPIMVDDRTKKLVSGHGRIDSLRKMQTEKQAPPEHIMVAEDGDWMVPVVRGHSFKNDQELEAFLVAANQLTINGGWDTKGLSAILRDAQSSADPEALKGMGYSADEVTALLSQADSQSFLDDIDQPGDESSEKKEQTHNPDTENITITFVVDAKDQKHVVEALKKAHDTIGSVTQGERLIHICDYYNKNFKDTKDASKAVKRSAADS